MLIQINKLIREHRGQAMVELALVLPVILLLTFGIMEFGRVMHAYIVVTNAAREGARSGVVGFTDSQVEAAVQNASVSLDTDKLSVSISPTQAGRSSGSSLSVTVQYPVTIYAPVIGSIVSNPYTVSGQAVMRVE